MPAASHYYSDHLDVNTLPILFDNYRPDQLSQLI
jgi:hypothetical protein